MALNIWRDRIDGVDDVSADDINSVANAVVEAEGEIGNISSKLLSNIAVPDPNYDYIYVKARSNEGHKDGLYPVTLDANINTLPVRGQRGELYGANLGEDLSAETFDLQNANRDILINAGTLRQEFIKQDYKLEGAKSELKEYTDKKVIEGALLDFAEDNSTAYTKTLPELYGEKAFIRSIGGVSGFVKNPEKTVNFLDPKDIKIVSPYLTRRGDIFTLNIPYEEGRKSYGTIFTLNVNYGFPIDEDSQFGIKILNGSFDDNLELIDLNEGGPLGEGVLGAVSYGGVFDLSFEDNDWGAEEAVYCQFVMYVNDINMGGYAPYYIWSESKVEKVESLHENLIPFPYQNGGTGTVKTVNGITFTVDANGWITANGTATANSTFVLSGAYVLPKGIYCLSGGISNKAYIVCTFGKGGAHITEKYSMGDDAKIDTTVIDYDSNQIYLTVTSGTTLTNAVFKPILNEGESAEPIDTVEIPQEIQAIEGYGRYGSTLDLERKVFIPSGRLILTGEESWTYTGINDIGLSNLSTGWGGKKAVSGNGTSSVYPHIEKTLANTTQESVLVTLNALNARAYINGATNAEKIAAWKAHLAKLYANGTPLIVDYKLESPTEIDVSDYLTGYDKFLPIKVESEGSLVFENEPKNAVPSEMITVAYAI